MPKRNPEPEEAIGPVVNGLENFPPLSVTSFHEPPLPEYEEAEPILPVEEIEDPILLLFGDGEVAHAVADLASQCGFSLEVASDEDEQQILSVWPEASAVYAVPDWDDLLESCGIGKNCFVCIFINNLNIVEHILIQCLPSDAPYLGVYGDMETRGEIFAGMRALGTPDAELAAIACPMGLNIGADTAKQHAVGIVAELLAAKAGTLKRLRHGEQKNQRLVRDRF